MFKKKQQTKSTTEGLEMTFEEVSDPTFSLDELLEEEKSIWFLPKQIELGTIYKDMLDNQPYNIGNYALAKVQERILDWNLQRGHLSYDASTEIDNYKEEIEEGTLAKELFDEALIDDEKYRFMQEYIDSYCDRYVFMVGALAKSYINNQPIEGQLLEYYQEFTKIPNTVKELGFDFVKCMDECLKEILSRKQDPDQKLKWEAQGGSLGEKWQKDLNQNPDTLYKADYKKCRIKECCK
jgi:hypothetical protein